MKPRICVLVAAFACVSNGLAIGQQAPIASPSRATLFSYQTLCSLAAPPEPTGGFRTKAGTSLSLTGCGDLEKQWGKQAAVRVHFPGVGSGESEVVVKGLASITISGTSTGSALGLQFRHPSSFGMSLDIASQLEGEVAFAVPAAGAVDLVVLFKRAAIGDSIKVGDAPAVRISK